VSFEIRPLTAELWPQLERLFAEGGDARWCFCTFWRFPDAGGRKEAERNRRLLRRLADDPPDGLPLGLLAFDGERPVGWVSLAPREHLPRLERSRLLAPVDERPVWSIVCFVVAKGERGRGIANALLDAAIDFARNHGASTLEAYPVETDGERVPGAYAYLGVSRMYEKAGFQVVATRRATPTTRPRRIMRLELT
jgi:GNAT superfamily N-acetyltransferase